MIIFVHKMMMLNFSCAYQLIFREMISTGFNINLILIVVHED